MMPGDERDDVGAPNDGRGQAKPPRLKWADLFGIDPDFTGGKDVDEFLAESRGEA